MPCCGLWLRMHTRLDLICNEDTCSAAVQAWLPTCRPVYVSVCLPQFACLHGCACLFVLQPACLLTAAGWCTCVRVCCAAHSLLRVPCCCVCAHVCVCVCVCRQPHVCMFMHDACSAALPYLCIFWVVYCVCVCTGVCTAPTQHPSVEQQCHRREHLHSLTG